MNVKHTFWHHNGSVVLLLDHIKWKMILISKKDVMHFPYQFYWEVTIHTRTGKGEAGCLSCQEFTVTVQTCLPQPSDIKCQFEV